MRNASLWRSLLGVEKTVVEGIEFDEDDQLLVAHVRPRARVRGRCGRCGRRSPGYDRGEGRRRWRALDLGTVQVYLEADAPRVACREHGPTVAAVPWARHGAGHTVVFDEQVAWLATQCSKSAVTELMRIAWRTVGAIITRVWADVEALGDRFAGLRRIGIDEISYKKGHRYLTIVVDHDREVAVALLVGDLIDADPSQAGEPVAEGLHVGPDPGDDRPDGAPGDAHQLGDRGLGALRGQPGHLLVEHHGVTGPVPGPRDGGHRGTVLAAGHPRGVGLEVDLHRAQIQRPPPPPTLATVVPGRPAPAPPAPATHSSPGTDMSHQELVVLIELDALHDRLLDAQQGPP